MSFGCLVVQTLELPTSDSGYFPTPAPDSQAFVVQIWPASRLIRLWPPPRRLNDEGIRVFSRNFIGMAS